MFAAVIVAASLTGCDEEPVRTYRVPKPHVVDPTAGRMHQHDHDHDHQHADAAAEPRPTDQAPMRDGVVPPTKPAAQLTYTVPEGWVEQENLRSMRVAAFTIPGEGEGEVSAEMTVIPLPAQVFEMTSNVNRWAGQVGLAEMSVEQVQQIVKPFEPAAPREAYEVDLPGEQQRIFAIMVLHAGQVWFYKMTGPVELTGQHMQPMRDFVAGVKYEAAP